VFSTVAARFYLHEQIDALRWAGVVLIVLGAGLITFTEKRKEAERVRQGLTETPRI
jgi:drug/metabolite transporter (DMT)-like permease